MSKTTFVGRVRSRGGSVHASAAVATLMLQASGDPTAVAAVQIGMLPRGAIPLSISSFGGATGGVSPTIDIGDGTTDDAFASGLAVDAAAVREAITGVGVALAEDTPVTMKVGASAATGGVATIAVEYVPADDQSL